MNIMHLQQYVAALEALRSAGSPLVVGAKLLPMPDGKTNQAMLFVKNIHKGAWLEEAHMIEIVNRVANAVQIPLVYGGHAVVGRTPDMFAPYADVEVFTTWAADSPEDELLNSKESACGVSYISGGKAILWGWLPAHVVETVGETVKIKTVRPVFSQGANGDMFIQVPYNAPWVRLVHDPQQVTPRKEGEVNVYA